MHKRFRQIAFFSLKLLVSLGLVFWAVSGIEFEQVANTLKNASLPLVVLACLVLLGSHFWGMLQWRVFLTAQSLKLSLRRIGLYYYTGQFFNNFLLSSVGGDLVRLFDVAHGEKLKKSRVLASILIDRIFGLVCLVLLGLVVLPFYLARSTANQGLIGGLYFGLAGIFLVFWTFVFSRKIRYLAFRLIKALPFKTLRRKALYFLRVFYRYGRSPRSFLRALGWGLVNQVTKLSVAFITLIALSGLPLAIDPLYLIVFIPILGIVKVLPISIMGLGPHEVVGIQLFAGVGLSQDYTLSFLFLYQLVAILSNLVCGVFLIGRLAERR